MLIYGKINFKDAIIVDEKLLRDLEQIILTFFEKVSYSCELCNTDKIDFDSLDELLDYENVKTRKIVRLSISFGYGNDIIFEPTSSLSASYKHTVKGTYVVDNSDNSILFSEKIKAALEKNKRNKWYTFFTKFSLFHFAMIICVISAVSSIHAIIQQGINEGISLKSNGLNFIIIAALLLFAIGKLLAKGRTALLPPISYMIGEQIKEIEKGEELFGKIFWGIVVAFIVSLVTSLIL